jgi:sugar phosphate isomerase/epimerase
MTYSTIKPLDRGNFDWPEFLADAERAGIDVPIAFINFLMPDAPSDYLPRSMDAWRKKTSSQN